MAPQKQRVDARFPYVRELPPQVPPIEDPSSTFPSDMGGTDLVTYYFPIKVMPAGQPNATGVFFPRGFRFSDDLNVILYFHGHKAGEFTTINEYWGEGKHNLFLREKINASGKQAVLIAPTMGALPGSSVNSGMGIFANKGAVDSYLAEVLQWIGKFVPQYAERRVTPTIGKLVLAGHSGAGGILLHQVMTMKTPVCEVWGFDSLYGWGMRNAVVNGKKTQEDIVTVEWLKAALSHQAALGLEPLMGVIPIPIPTLRPATQFFFYWWARNSVGLRALNLQSEIANSGLHNVTILQSEKVDPSDGWESHFGTVRVNFQRRVADARCF